ncbi:hypothetical protein V6C31_09165 [Caldibacillus debilis]|uniref:hypothetical protein n=1 Tax=Caldibacillus debilis TaxID=301148 RepID=UPI002FD993E9
MKIPPVRGVRLKFLMGYSDDLAGISVNYLQIVLFSCSPDHLPAFLHAHPSFEISRSACRTWSLLLAFSVAEDPVQISTDMIDIQWMDHKMFGLGEGFPELFCGISRAAIVYGHCQGFFKDGEKSPCK